MNSRVLVLGAGGRLGHKAAEAFRDAGWTVTSLVRPGRAARVPAGTQPIEVDALDHAAVSTAARGADVILHALNPFYTDWSRLALPLAYSAITAAEATGATLMFPGNLYNYGSPMPPVIDETTPMRPSSRKGQMRVAMEDRMAKPPNAACARSFCAPEISMAADADHGSISCCSRRSAAAA